MGKTKFGIAASDVLVSIGLVAIFLGLVAFATYFVFANALSSKEAVMNNNNTGLVLLDRNNRPFFKFYQAHYSDFVPISQIPDVLQEAVISAEDKEFYSHPGFSIKALIGATIADIKDKDSAYGGSTITQQLVKNSFLSSQKSIMRKYQEIVLAQEIERRYSKQEILEMYLNSVYFGEGAFGIGSASQTYFGVDANQLNLAQSAMLAGLLTSPSKLSPITGDYDLAKSRQAFILNAMAKQKYITQSQADAAKNYPLALNKEPSGFDFRAPHFAIMVKDALVQKYGEEQIARSGYVVKTSLDLDWQTYTENVVADQVSKLTRNNVSNGAAVVEDPTTGEIKALVGSKDWNQPVFGKVNVTTSLRQPGSSFKPIIYAKAFEEQVITPATILMDNPITYKPGPGVAEVPYSPRDYDGRYRGPVLVRRALANSLNIPAVQVMNKIGVPSALEMTERLGFTTFKDPTNYGISLALGSGEVKLLELTNAYATFANQGQENQATSILEIKDKKNQSIYQYQPNPKQVLDPDIAFLITSILSDNTARAEEFGNLLTVSRPAAVKTGTTEDYRDSLTVGYTPNLVVGVWVGNNDGKPMDQIAGSIGAAPIWKSLIEKFSQGTPVEKFAMPNDGIVTVSICRSNGLRVREATASAYKEFFLAGTQPEAFCATPAPKPSGSSSSSPTPTPTRL